MGDERQAPVPREGDLLEADKVARHALLESALVKGIARSCMALWRIREEETYRVLPACKSYGDYLARKGISNASGRLYANAGPVFAELEKTGHLELVKHVELLKPVYKLPDPKRVAEIVRRSAVVAARRQEPLTAKLVAEVASREYRWKTPAERKAAKAGKKAAVNPTHEKLIKALYGVWNLNLRPDVAVEVARIHREQVFRELDAWFTEVRALGEELDDVERGIGLLPSFGVRREG